MPSRCLRGANPDGIAGGCPWDRRRPRVLLLPVGPPLWYLIASVLAVGSLVLLVLVFGAGLSTATKLPSSSIDWITLIVSGVLLSLVFRRDGQKT